jgi:hypothetical protein
MRDDEDDTSVPDVNACVQEILSHIFTSMYNHQVGKQSEIGPTYEGAKGLLHTCWVAKLNSSNTEGIGLEES